MMKDAVFAGVNAAVLTPVRDNLAPDLDRMAAHCRWLLANGCNGLGVLGTTGEANSLGVAQRVEIMEGLAERGIAPAALMPGTGTPALADTVFLTQRAQALGCKGVLVLPPFFYKNPTEDGLFAYFSELVNRIGARIRIYLYHFPQQSAVPITLSLIARLLKAFPGIIKGAKDSSGDFANTSAMVREFGRACALPGTASRSRAGRSAPSPGPCCGTACRISRTLTPSVAPPSSRATSPATSGCVTI
jgi:4-hydroxy-tetrahydrodipicolinate synthase